MLNRMTMKPALVAGFFVPDARPGIEIRVGPIDGGQGKHVNDPMGVSVQ
ncbi:hypothetical protein D777_03136 [Marinobacter nitratireducens]|uniref:Uncharacterized protein n=1 Tax=Marinobacter nitratireducens TaxID=1137280 RepID=A0A072NA81_9GAMM|nr:hypothetical protein D777_03136 [Marinobacter nitratireducens]